MSDKFTIERLIELQDKISEDITQIKVIQAKQEENLREHMRRTQILEERQDKFVEHFDTELKPIKSHINLIEAGLKIGGIGAAIISMLATILKVISYLTKLF